MEYRKRTGTNPGENPRTITNKEHMDRVLTNYVSPSESDQVRSFELWTREQTLKDKADEDIAYAEVWHCNPRKFENSESHEMCNQCPEDRLNEQD